MEDIKRPSKMIKCPTKINFFINGKKIRIPKGTEVEIEVSFKESGEQNPLDLVISKASKKTTFTILKHIQG